METQKPTFSLQYIQKNISTALFQDLCKFYHFVTNEQDLYYTSELKIVQQLLHQRFRVIIKENPILFDDIKSKVEKMDSSFN